jgi:hypothetical protein
MTQHAMIRTSLEACGALAARFCEGAPVAAKLEVAVQDLRREIAVHNDTENALIRALLVRTARWGDQLIDRMLEEHRGEHDTMWALLTGTVEEVAPHMPELIEELEAHMAAEERTFLAVLRTDVIERHG